MLKAHYYLEAHIHMAGNISGTLVEENLASAPDYAALQQMVNPRLTVTKIIKIGSNKVDEQLVVNGKKGMTIDEMIALQDALPTMTKQGGGPGNYRFQVTDDDSPAKVLWKVRLGVTNEENAGGSPVSNPVAPKTIAPIHNPMPSEDTINVGNGWWYTKSLGTLTSPMNEIFSWRPGQPLPKTEVTPPPPAAMTPISALPTFGGPSPEVQAMQTQLQAMQTALAESQRLAREAQDNAKELKQQQELERVRAEAKAQNDAMLAEVQALRAAMTAKPDSTNAELLAIKQELAEAKRMDALRADFNAKIDTLQAIVRESANGKQDPMITMLMQMMQQQQASAAENLRIMRESAQSQAQLAGANAMTPEKLMALMERMKEGSGLSETVMASLGSAFEQVVKMSSVAREMAGSGDNGGGLMAVLEKVGTQAGSALQNYMQYKANLAAAEEAKARTSEVQTRAIAAQQNRQAQRPVAPVAPAAPTLSLAEAQDARLGLVPSPTPSTPPTLTVVPLEETQIVPPMVTAEDNDEEEEQESIEVSPPPESPLARATIEELRTAFEAVSDDVFFGPLKPFIDELRRDIGKYGTQDIATFVLQARDQLLVQKDKIDLPQCMEMLGWGQYEYLIERLLPRIKAKSRSAIVARLKALIEAETTTDPVA